MVATENLSFQDLLQALACKYEQARSFHGVPVHEKAPWDIATPPPEMKHQEHIVWQDWEVNRGDTLDSVTDPFYNSPKPNFESILAVNVSKTSPAPSWQKAEYQMMNSGTIQTPRLSNSLEPAKANATGRTDRGRVAPPVAALRAPPQESVEIGIEDVDHSFGATVFVSSVSHKDGEWTSNHPTFNTLNFESESDTAQGQLTREKEEKRIRRQFKRLARKGVRRGEMRRLYASQLQLVIMEMRVSGRLSGLDAVPTVEKVNEAVREFITTEYSSERVTRILAARPSSSAVTPSNAEVCLDLATYFDLITKDFGNNLSGETVSVISLVRAACQKESSMANDTDSIGSVPSNKPLGLLRISDNRLDTLSAFVILLNAVVIGISADIDKDGIQWEVLEILFTIYFMTEMLYKMKMMGCKVFFLGPDWHWNTFDAIVVLIAIFDLSFTNIVRLVAGPGGNEEANLGSFTIIKMARLGRLARLVRLLRFKIFSELKLMIQGVVVGLRVLFWAFVLLFFFIYLLGVVLRKTMGESELHHYAVKSSFETVPRSMLTLFRCFTDGCTAYDGTPLQVHLFEYYGAAFMLAYMLIFLFVTMGIFNLIMAIFIDNVMEASVHRKQQERGANAAAMELSLKELIAELVSKSHKRRRSDFLTQANHALSAVEARVSSILDLDDPVDSYIARKTVVDRDLAAMDAEKVTIDRETFESWLAESDFLAMLEDLDIGSSNKSELFDVLDCDLSGELEVSEVISGLMKLRGPSDKSDAVAALLAIRYMTDRLDNVFRVVCEGVGRLTFREERSDMSSPKAPATGLAFSHTAPLKV